MVTPESVESGGLGLLEKELGVFVPISPVLIQLDNFAHLDVGKQGGNRLPQAGYFSWLTTKLRLPKEYDYYEGFAAIDAKGFASNMGIAIPLEPEEEVFCEFQLYDRPVHPFWFFHNGIDGAEIAPIHRVVDSGGKRRLLEEMEYWVDGDYEVEIRSEQVLEGDVRAWMIGHQFVNSLITRSIYSVFDLGDADMNEVLLGGEKKVEQESFFGRKEKTVKIEPWIKRGFLISGREQRGQRVGLKPSLPLEMLRGKEEPILVGEGRLFGRELKRFQGFDKAPQWVY